MHKRYVQVKSEGLALTLEEYKRDVDRMGQTIQECRAVVMDKYDKGFDRLTSYFDKVLDVFEVAKITCDCVISDLQKQKEREYMFRYWYRRLQAENMQLRYQVQSIIDELRAEHHIQIERVRQELNERDSMLRREQEGANRLRAQLHYERHMFGNDYVVQAHERVRIVEKTNSELVNEIEKYRARETELNAWVENIIHHRNGIQKEGERDRAVIRALQLENEQLREASYNDNDDQKVIKALQQELQQLKDENKGKQGDDRALDQEKQLAGLQYELNRTKQELIDTKDRLSKLLSQKLTDNNPNIADLSDKNRPTKLAERYTELYDNQWTNAFEKLDTNQEQDTIASLKAILLDAAQYCRKEADHQLSKLKHVLVGSDKAIPAVIYKSLKDSRKAMAELYGETIYQRYLDTLRKSTTAVAKEGIQVESYLKECFQICWLMSVQDPPVVLGPEAARGGPLDSQVYKAYTKNGPTIDYVVWPALYLSEGGSLLSKGVAQGCEQVQKDAEKGNSTDKKENLDTI